MRSKWFVLALAMCLFAVIAFSQGSSDIKVKTSKINDKLSVDEKQHCETAYYETTEPVFANITKTRDTYGICYNPSNQSNYTCVNGTESYVSLEQNGSVLVNKPEETCKAKSFVVETKGSRKEVDFSSWGVCIQEVEGNCVSILCGTLEGGSARNGIFNGCDGGKQCKKFLFCENGIRVLHKAARGQFHDTDPTFKLPELIYQGVGE